MPVRSRVSIALCVLAVAAASCGSSRAPAAIRASAPSSPRPGITAVPAVAVRARAGNGRLVPFMPRADVSHFLAVAGSLYLPPAYLRGDRSLPVLIVLGGPGSRWPRIGFVKKASDAFAAVHGGVAPILAFVDENGTIADSECVDGPLGKADTYITVDVPADVVQTLGLRRPRFGIFGFSEGGTCALVLALRHPSVFTTVLDVAGDLFPNLAPESRTLKVLFGGSATLARSYDPYDLLAHHTYGSLDAWFAAGADDATGSKVMREESAWARRAGARSHLFIDPASAHSWLVAQRAFEISVADLLRSLSRS